MRIVHFEKNAFEDICVDDGRKSLATGTKYKPKQMKVSKHAMLTSVYHIKLSKVACHNILYCKHSVEMRQHRRQN